MGDRVKSVVLLVVACNSWCEDDDDDDDDDAEDDDDDAEEDEGEPKGEMYWKGWQGAAVGEGARARGRS